MKKKVPTKKRTAKRTKMGTTAHRAVVVTPGLAWECGRRVFRNGVPWENDALWRERVGWLGQDASLWNNYYVALRQRKDVARRERVVSVTRILSATFQALILGEDELLGALSNEARKVLDVVTRSRLDTPEGLMFDAGIYAAPDTNGWFVSLTDPIEGDKGKGVFSRSSIAQIEVNTLAWRLECGDSVVRLAEGFLGDATIGPLHRFLSDHEVGVTIEEASNGGPAHAKVVRAFERCVERSTATTVAARRGLAEKLLVAGVMALGVRKDAAHGLMKAEEMRERRKK